MKKLFQVSLVSERFGLILKLLLGKEGIKVFQRPRKYIKLFVDDKYFASLKTELNRYCHQKALKCKIIKQDRWWMNTTVSKLKKFLVTKYTDETG